MDSDRILQVVTDSPSDSMPTSRWRNDNDEITTAATTTSSTTTKRTSMKRRRTTTARVSTTTTFTTEKAKTSAVTTLQPTPTYNGDYESVDKHKVNHILSSNIYLQILTKLLDYLETV